MALLNCSSSDCFSVAAQVVNDGFSPRSGAGLVTVVGVRLTMKCANSIVFSSLRCVMSLNEFLLKPFSKILSAGTKKTDSWTCGWAATKRFRRVAYCRGVEKIGLSGSRWAGLTQHCPKALGIGPITYKSPSKHFLILLTMVCR